MDKLQVPADAAAKSPSYMRSQKSRGLAALVVFILVLFFVMPHNAGPKKDLARFNPDIDAPFEVGCREPDVSAPRAKAAILILARNSDIQGVSVSMSSFERHFNRWFHYPYVILNDEPFTDTFKETVSRFTTSKIEFGQIDAKDWEFPSSVNEEEVQKSLNAQGDAAIPYGRLKSYHQMCRFFSGKFYKHPLLEGLDWYWRVEPDIQFFCDMTYDPFLEMEKHNKVYGFNAFIAELPSTIPSLFRQTLAFKNKHSIPDTDMWPTITQCITERERYDHRHEPKWPPVSNEYMNGCKYNLCHFWSNFEIARLDLWRQPLYEEYFNHLEEAGGFWHERWGDAPVHTFGVGLFLNASQVHYFRDVGYVHTGIGHCPKNAPGKQIPLEKYGKYTEYDDFWKQQDPEKQFGTGCRCRCPPLRETEEHSCFDKLLAAYGNPSKDYLEQQKKDSEFKRPE